MHWHNKILLACAGILAGLMCVELVLAFLFPQPNFYFFEYAPGGYIFHKPDIADSIAQAPKKGIIAMPGNKSVSVSIRQYTMFLRTNNAGFRSDLPVAYEKTDRYRILHLGDSLGFGFPLTREESYAGRIESLVPGTEVLNASTVFTHTARLLQYYQKEGYKYDPDMVIVQLTISHPGGDYLSLDVFGKSKFELSSLQESGKRDAVQSFITKDEAGIDQLSWTYSKSTKLLFDLLNKKLDTASFLYDYFNITRLIAGASDFLKTPIDAISRGYIERMGPLTKSYQPVPGYTSDSPNTQSPSPFSAMTDSAKNIDSRFTRTYLEAFKNMLATEHKELMVIVIPNKLGCHGITYPAWEKLFQELPDDEYHVIDFYPDFCDGAAHKPREQFFLPQEIHLNAAGDQLIAERLASEVAKLKRVRR